MAKQVVYSSSFLVPYQLDGLLLDGLLLDGSANVLLCIEPRVRNCRGGAIQDE